MRKNIWCVILLLTLAGIQLCGRATAEITLDFPITLPGIKGEARFSVTPIPMDDDSSGFQRATITLKQGQKTLSQFSTRFPYMLDEPLDTPGIQVIQPEGFSPEVRVISIPLEPQACGFPGGEFVTLWDGKQLQAGFSTIVVGEAGLFHSEDKVFYPDDLGPGNENRLMVLTTVSQFKDELNQYVPSRVTRTDYWWNGKQLIKLSELSSPEPAEAPGE